MRLKASYELAEVLELIKDARQLGMEIGTREGYKDGLDKGNEDGYGNGYRECLMAYYEILEGTHEFDRDCKIFGLRG